MNPMTEDQIAKANKIVAAVCNELNISHTPESFRGRTPRAWMARALATRMLREHMQLSYPQIASVTSKTSHSSLVDVNKDTNEKLAIGGHKYAAIEIAEWFKLVSAKVNAAINEEAK